MLLGMPFLKAANPHINWTHSAFKGKVYAITSDAHKWKPNQDSKVYKPFYKPPTKGYRHHERTSSPIQYMHVEPDDYIALRRTHIENVLLRRLTKAAELAAKEADQTQHPWQELVLLEYHRFGKVFSDEEAQRFSGKRPWDHAIDLMDDAPPMLNPSRKSMFYIRFLSICSYYVCCDLSTSITIICWMSQFYARVIHTRLHRHDTVSQK